MIRFNQALSFWKTPQFKEALKEEIRRLGVAALPLQQGLTKSSHVSGDAYDVIVLGVSEEPECICVRVGVFYQGVIAGCSCADDPTPTDEQTEYCELLFRIDKETAEAAVTLLQD
jgi:hypothetical protein